MNLQRKITNFQIILLILFKKEIKNDIILDMTLPRFSVLFLSTLYRVMSFFDRYK